MATTEIFGTDGIRGRAGEEWLSPAAVYAVGQAAGASMSHGDKLPALLGHDGRRSGPELERALAAGLAAAGIESHSVGLIPTPGLAWLVRQGSYCLGAMLSASHNPAADNGIKLFSARGGKPTDADQSRMEELLGGAAGLHQLASVDPSSWAAPIGHPEQEAAYLKHLIEDKGAMLDLRGKSLVIDCANGAGSRVAPEVLRQLGATVHCLAIEPDGTNINDRCGSTHPEAMQAAVSEHGAHLGISLDGDGDRCILSDETGALVHGDGIMTVIARHAAQQNLYGDPRIVATVMSNRGLHRALKEVGVSVLEVAVGDRAVVEAMREHSLDLGGEQSGHIILGHDGGFIGDGLVTALAVLEVMQASDVPLSILAAPYQPYPQVLLNVPVDTKPDLDKLPRVVEAAALVERELGEEGRVLLRYSGTENVARVMVEGPDEPTIKRQADKLAQTIQASLALPQ